MKIAFDAQLFLKGDKTGIGWCADNIIRNIINDSYNECQLNCFTLKYSEEEMENVNRYIANGVTLKKCNWFHDVIYKFLWTFLPIPYSWFFGKDADVTQFFNFIIPPGVKGKKVTIIHDMAYKACPETVRLKTRLWLELTVKNSCKRADKIITVSEFSKREIIKYLGINEDKIVVMPNGVDLSSYHTDFTDDEISAIKEKYGIQSEYLLFIGTLEPRKNIVRIIKAYSLLVKSNQNVPKLVIAGRKGWMYEEIFRIIVTENIEEHVIFTGYVDSCDIPKLLFGAEIFLFPTIYEGFGMPVLEAMACGTAVITSNITSLPEIVGDAGYLVNPLSESEIKNAIQKILLDDKLKMELVTKGLERVQLYSWKKSVAILYKVYEELLSNKGQEHSRWK